MQNKAIFYFHFSYWLKKKTIFSHALLCKSFGTLPFYINVMEYIYNCYVLVKRLHGAGHSTPAQRGSIQQDELSPQEKQAIQGEEQQQKITSYEEAFRRIKEATGVSDTMVLELDYEDIFDLMYKLLLFDLYVS
jgi:hypothetical protein